MYAIHIGTLLLCFATAIGARVARFDNYQVFNVQVDTDLHFEAVRQLAEGNDGGDISVWNGVRLGQASDVMVAPHRLADFHEILQRSGLNSTVKVENVQALIDSEHSSTNYQSDTFGWTSYHSLESIYKWLDAQVAAHSAILSNIDIGLSYENRTIRAVKLSHKAGNPAIVIEANIHAREWITSATATWLLNELLTSTAADVRELAQNIDWYIVPVLNVDGFVYTHEANRLWRKTRQPHNLLCHGADPNRNFDRFWRLYNGASANPCSDHYGGPKANSEPEVAAYSKFYETIAKSVKVYFSLHAYGQFILTPFGHTFELPDNHDDLMRVAQKGKEAIAVRENRQYTIGPIAEKMVQATGSTIDYAYGMEGLKLAFAFELRDSENGPYGFILPADQIVPNALETFDGLKAMIAEARALKYLDV